MPILSMFYGIVVRMYFFDDGLIVENGTPDQIFKNLAGLDKFVDQAGKAWKCKL